MFILDLTFTLLSSPPPRQCRLAFHGRMAAQAPEKADGGAWLKQLSVCKWKERRGMVERVHDSRTLIGSGLFQKDTRIDKYVNMKVSLSTGESGIIEGSFGQSGKFKVRRG